jgi:uncharacterized membrane protein YcaP (DUF421 family)
VPQWIVIGWVPPAVAAGKAAIMYVIALAGLRLTHRRALSQWTAIDYAAAVALGAIVGRTAIAGEQSVAVGAAALVTILAAHRALAHARRVPGISRLVDHRVRVLVEHGRVRSDQLRRCGLTEPELLAQLRRQGVGELCEVRYVLYEAMGDLTVVREDGGTTPDTDLVRAGLRDAMAFPAADPAPDPKPAPGP